MIIQTNAIIVVETILFANIAKKRCYIVTNVYFIVENFEFKYFRMKENDNIIEIRVFEIFEFNILIDCLNRFFVIFAVCVVFVLFVKSRYKCIIIRIIRQQFLRKRKHEILNCTRKILKNTLRKK